VEIPTSLHSVPWYLFAFHSTACRFPIGGDFPVTLNGVGKRKGPSDCAWTCRLAIRDPKHTKSTNAKQTGTTSCWSGRRRRCFGVRKWEGERPFKSAPRNERLLRLLSLAFRSALIKPQISSGTARNVQKRSTTKLTIYVARPWKSFAYFSKLPSLRICFSSKI